MRSELSRPVRRPVATHYGRAGGRWGGRTAVRPYTWRACFAQSRSQMPLCRHSGESRNPGISRRKPGTRLDPDLRRGYVDPVFQRGDGQQGLAPALCLTRYLSAANF